MTLMMALEEKKQEGVEELEQAILLVRNGCSTVEALEENGISRAIAEKALKLA